MRRTIIQSVRAAGFSGRVAVVSHSEADSLALRAAGADLILEPFQDAADRALERMA